MLVEKLRLTLKYTFVTLALVDDHILRAQTMHASPYIAPLEPLLQSWEEQLVGVQDTIDVWLKVILLNALV